MLKRVATGLVLAATSLNSVAGPSGEPVIRKYYAESKPGTAPTLPDTKGTPNVIWILMDLGAPVGAYRAPFKLNGAIRQVTLDTSPNATQAPKQ